jgi:hypothetical protein
MMPTRFSRLAIPIPKITAAKAAYPETPRNN